MGSVLSVGALLVTQVAGSPALSGMAATMSTIGAAAAAIPLAALAARRGRATALTTGALLAAGGAGLGIVASVLSALPLLLIAIVFIGVGTAVNLQSRFAATDLSEPHTRGRDIALVVWATTVGAVGGPNLIDLGDRFGQTIGLPPLSGPFIFTIVAQASRCGDLPRRPAARPTQACGRAHRRTGRAGRRRGLHATTGRACAPASSRSRSATRPWSESWP